MQELQSAAVLQARPRFQRHVRHQWSRGVRLPVKSQQRHLQTGRAIPFAFRSVCLKSVSRLSSQNFMLCFIV